MIPPPTLLNVPVTTVVEALEVLEPARLFGIVSENLRIDALADGAAEVTQRRQSIQHCCGSS